MPALSPEMRRIRDACRIAMLEFSRRAFARLSGLPASPRILDMGCGNGLVSRELARLSGGVVTGIDIDPMELREFARRARQAGLNQRMHAVCMNFARPGFQGPGFDLLWAEGVTRFIPPQEAWRQWACLAAPGGLLVLHEERALMEGGAGGITAADWNECGRMTLPADAWWRHYYRPLWVRFRRLQARGVNFPQAERDALRREIAALRREPERCATAFYFYRRAAAPVRS